MNSLKFLTFSEIISSLKNFWNLQNCTILQPLDIIIGAGTFHHQTFFTALNSKKKKIAYVQPTRRPSDGRYTQNPNRLQHYYQFQVLLKPAPKNIQQIFIQSLQHLNIDIKKNDIRFLEDNWENTTLGACGVGWEIWINGMEIAQFTYFQQMGGLNSVPISTEITYGLERLALHIQQCKNISEIIWTQNKNKITTYGQLFNNFEQQHSLYNFSESNSKILYKLYKIYLKESKRLNQHKKILIIPAYEHMLHAIHYFNLLDCKKTFSVTERTHYIKKIRTQIKEIALNYLKNFNNN
ncbi:glycine--tRNA ligase subunit alpha [Buchnera aphidicola]|uniref:Glycine--tRNA ligase alpha subunit n=1 Tax=Buchnera aphidicola subsp. Tuberolachnus salignus TaxID=98804 RepID=A0A160SX87_BUCTT|nr:glycine--tRNA ligase subunit alpha [Buchnera aphidicola]CUR53075.1 Glycine--tRNA ligase alpha subunit [Buchnera aphidicola (Tuberolachnus salignus)]